MLKIPLTAKILPIRILYPHLNYCLIAEIIGVFEIVQTYHKTCGFGWPAETWGVEFSEGIVKLRPVDDVGQFA
jgi:hypothetical protein